VTVDCADLDDDALESEQPTVLFEVLSPSTRSVGLVRKSHEYQSLATLRHLVLIEPQWVEVHVWSRSGDGAWPKPARLLDVAEAIELTAVGIRLPLADVYASVRLVPRPSP
jgi:Uma2 family endonuclease